MPARTTTTAVIFVTYCHCFRTLRRNMQNIVPTEGQTIALSTINARQNHNNSYDVRHLLYASDITMRVRLLGELGTGDITTRVRLLGELGTGDITTRVRLLGGLGTGDITTRVRLLGELGTGDITTRVRLLGGLGTGDITTRVRLLGEMGTVNVSRYTMLWRY
ncbi:hypothetical protein J6590_011321 [Homalodisca vitripennis]|nr:hypothetical protein J6590_011321 [Homalodisca vitripennis]